MRGLGCQWGTARPARGNLPKSEELFKRQVQIMGDRFDELWMQRLAGMVGDGDADAVHIPEDFVASRLPHLRESVLTNDADRFVRPQAGRSAHTVSSSVVTLMASGEGSG